MSDEKGIARFEDLCTGHGPYPPRPNIEASTDTFCNNRGIHCQTHQWDIHCSEDCHGGELLSGKEDVLCNWLEVGRCDDPVSCGSLVATCSEDTLG